HRALREGGDRMSIVSDAAEVLIEALRTVDGVRYHDLGASIDPPALVLGMPKLALDAQCPGQLTVATFPIFLVVAMDDRAQLRLWELAEPVAAAIESVTGAAITSADPDIYVAGAQQLPCYAFTTEMSLT